jgi:hypothetical protein
MFCNWDQTMKFLRLPLFEATVNFFITIYGEFSPVKTGLAFVFSLTHLMSLIFTEINCTML